MSSVFVQLDQSYYFQGAVVTGKVYLNLVENLVGTSTLQLKIKGWESVKWIEMRHIPQDPQNPVHLDQSKLLEADDVNITSDSSDSDEQLPKNQPMYLKKKNGEIYEVVRYENDKKLVKEKLKLYKWNSEYIPAGQYQFPFQFSLNKEWPGTYSDKKPKERARIKYEMKAICELPDR